MDLHESGEMYLETILLLKNKNKIVRSIDVANELNYSKPSVSRAMKILRERELIVIDDKGYIDFTDQGQDMAEGVYKRHLVLKDFLIHIGVKEAQAENDACRIEHIISEETFQCLKNFMEEQS